MPPFDIRGARGRGNPRPRRRTRSIPTKLYTPLTGAGRRSTPRRVVTRNHRAVVTRQAYRPNPKRVISHRRVQALQKRAQQRAAMRIESRKRAAEQRQTAAAFRSRIPGAGRVLGSKLRGERHQRYLARHPEMAPLFAAHATPGVQSVANAEYRKYTNDLWRRVQGHYPATRRPPKLHIQHVRGEGAPSYLLAQTYPRSERLRGKPLKFQGGADWQAMDAVPLSALVGGGGQNYARSVPLHEWAHVFQDVRQHPPRWQLEGAAEAFEQDLARRIRIPSDTNRIYRGYARRVRRRKGRKYIHRGQFR